MNYVKHFSVLGVDTRQVACIELRGAPTAATEGAVGVLGIDVTSPTRDVYKCVGVNGGVYTWMPISEMPEVKDGENGLSLLSAVESRSGLSVVTFPFYQLNTPSGYTVKIGDMILDPEGYIYQVTSIEVDSCTAKYIGERLLTNHTLGEFEPAQMVSGGYVGTRDNVVLTFDVLPDIIIFPAQDAVIYPRQHCAFIGGTNKECFTVTNNTVTITAEFISAQQIYNYYAMYRINPSDKDVSTVRVTMSYSSYNNYTYSHEFIIDASKTWADVANQSFNTYGYPRAIESETGYVMCQTNPYPTNAALYLDTGYLQDSEGNYVLGTNIVKEGDYTIVDIVRTEK